MHRTKNSIVFSCGGFEYFFNKYHENKIYNECLFGNYVILSTSNIVTVQFFFKFHLIENCNFQNNNFSIFNLCSLSENIIIYYDKWHPMNTHPTNEAPDHIDVRITVQSSNNVAIKMVVTFIVNKIVGSQGNRK